MDKMYTIFKDPTGATPMEHRITYTVRKPRHKKYNFADASFCFDPEKRSLKRLDFFIDEKLVYVNLALGVGRASAVWFFQKKGSFKPVPVEEVDLVLRVAEDVLKNNPEMATQFKNVFEVLPRQAKAYKRMFYVSTTNAERQMIAKSLRQKNKLIQYAQSRYKKILEEEKARQGEIEK